MGPIIRLHTPQCIASPAILDSFLSIPQAFLGVGVAGSHEVAGYSGAQQFCQDEMAHRVLSDTFVLRLQCLQLY